MVNYCAGNGLVFRDSGLGHGALDWQKLTTLGILVGWRDTAPEFVLRNRSKAGYFGNPQRQNAVKQLVNQLQP